MASFFPQWAQDLNTLVSFISFGISLYVAFGIRAIKRKFLARTRLPKITKDIQQAASSLNRHMNSLPHQYGDAVTEIKRALELMRAASKLVNYSECREINTHIKRITRKVETQAIKKDPRLELSQREIVVIYGDIQAGMVAIQQIEQNSQWN